MLLCLLSSALCLISIMTPLRRQGHKPWPGVSNPHFLQSQRSNTHLTTYLKQHTKSDKKQMYQYSHNLIVHLYLICIGSVLEIKGHIGAIGHDGQVSSLVRNSHRRRPSISNVAEAGVDVGRGGRGPGTTQSSSFPS